MLKSSSPPAADKTPVYAGPMFDADTHLYETPDAWTRYFPKSMQKQWGVALKRGADGDFTYYVGDRKVDIAADYMNEDGRVAAPGKLHEWLKAMKEGKSDIDLKVHKSEDMLAPAARVEKLDQWDVRSSILYVGEMVALTSYYEEPEPAYEMFNAYNRWMLDQWTFNYKDRIYPTPFISLMDLDKACEQVKWVIDNGARAILMPMGPVHGRAPAHAAHDRFWSLVNEAKLRVVFHIGETLYMRDHMKVWGEAMQQPRLRMSAFLWMHGYSERPVIETLSSFVFYNFFERFPNIKIMSAENGAEWVPAMLVKMDKVRGMARGGPWPCGQLKERPSTIFKQNIGVVAYPEDNIKLMIEQTGSADWIFMGSDYPHAEGVEEPRVFANEACQGIAPGDVRKIMYENGMKFMGLPLDRDVP